MYRTKDNDNTWLWKLEQKMIGSSATESLALTGDGVSLVTRAGEIGGNGHS